MPGKYVMYGDTFCNRAQRTYTISMVAVVGALYVREQNVQKMALKARCYTSSVVWPPPYAWAQPHQPEKYQATMDRCLDLIGSNQRGEADTCRDGFFQTSLSDRSTFQTR